MWRLSWNSVLVVVSVIFSLLLVANVHADGSRHRQILIRTRLIELDRTKLKNLGVDFVAYEKEETPSKREKNGDLFPNRNTVKSIDTAAQSIFFTTLDSLYENGIAKVLAEPTIISYEGQPTSLACGTKIERGGRPEADNDHEAIFIGTKLDVESQLVGNNRVRIDLHIDCSKLVGSKRAVESPPIKVTAIPIVHHQEVKTKFEVELGETFTLRGLMTKVHEGNKTKHTELVLLVTPELFDEPQGEE